MLSLIKHLVQIALTIDWNNDSAVTSQGIL